jgi:hypothetical protein
LLLGKPVIGTDYSGNTDFLNANTGYPVPYELVPVGAGEYPDHEGQVWAEPDIGVAARHMASIVDDPAIAEARALAGQAFIKTHHSLCGRRQIDARPAGLAWPARRARNLSLMAMRHSTRKRCPLRGIDFEKMKSTSLAWNRAMSRDCASLRCPSMAYGYS